MTIVGVQLIDRVGRRRLLLIGAAGMCFCEFIVAIVCSRYATPYLVNPTTTGLNGVKAANLGVKVFFIWGSTCVGCFLFTYFFIPETKGLSLEQIDLLYRESSIINSEKYRKQIIASNETYTAHKAGVKFDAADEVHEKSSA
ncbi:hypothetical protein H0H81_005586 [Sphagnurus paluster]|uniref:Major facilitator superfamily (MFS) profile domain-containing protein n=1 Tax=Sphagnurus paluster TaxID=117069 RepID=A0A9P7KL28_9AGAR|nr:hypothetical protein H0H81_005586 [Sphagnurus paluster]